jgi:protoporphyrinogen/coproporphyrinogen III oxidase
MADVIIIGAGISGLSCAWNLKKLGIDAVVLEAASRPGGVIRTEKINGYQIEWGPNSIQPTPAALKLIYEAGLWDDLLPPNPNVPRYIYFNGRLQKAPFGVMTLGTLARALGEPFIRSKSPPGESVRDFFTRRFGKQAHDRLVAPILMGIYATDTALLSMAAVWPRMLEMEREYGSLTAAMLRSFTRKSNAPAVGKPKPKGFTFSFPEGNETLPARVAQSLDIQYDETDAHVGMAPATVVTIPAYRAARLVGQAHPDIGKLLDEVQYSPMIVAAVSVPETSFKEPLRGFGFLAPRTEGLHILGAIFSSALFPGRAPEGQVLLTSFIGGSFEPEVLDWPDDRVWDIVCSELQRVLRSETRPDPIALRRHPHALPQYRIGHERWVASLKEELQRTPGLFITANYMDGASVPACIEQGERTADQVAEYLRRKA